MQVWLIKDSNNNVVPKIYSTKQDAVKVIKNVFGKRYKPFKFDINLTFVW